MLNVHSSLVVRPKQLVTGWRWSSNLTSLVQLRIQIPSEQKQWFYLEIFIQRQSSIEWDYSMIIKLDWQSTDYKMVW